jgi:hypothetical protein
MTGALRIGTLVSVQKGGPVMNRTVSAACAIVLSATLSASAATLIHSYDFDTGTVTDGTGSIDGTLVNGATILSGVLTLDGANDFVQLAGFAIPTIGNDFSVALRARQSTSFSYPYIELISQGESTGGPMGYGFYIGTSPEGIRLGDRFPAADVNEPFPADRAWHDYVLTSAAVGGTRFYIDGALIFSSDSEMDVVAGGTATRFGTQFAPFSEHFAGRMDDIMIWSGALSADEVAAYSTPSVVPLPSGAPLLLAGLGALALVRRRTA